MLGDERPYAVALVVPDWGAVRRELGVQGDPSSLVADDRVRGAIQRLVDELNADLGSWERVKQFELLPQDFSEATGELTPTLKVKRRVVQQRYRDLIEKMYSGKRQPAEAQQR